LLSLTEREKVVREVHLEVVQGDFIKGNDSPFLGARLKRAVRIKSAKAYRKLPGKPY